MSRRAVGRPPGVPGVLAPGVVDQLRFLWWTERGFLHGTTRGSWRERFTSAVLAVGWWPSLVLTIPMVLVQAHSPHRRQYMSPGRDAVLAVKAASEGLWVVEDHVSRQPGSGQGRRLRNLVIRPLLKAADASAVTIEVTAANQRLIDSYRAELEGLQVADEPRQGRGVRLRRLPILPS